MMKQTKAIVFTAIITLLSLGTVLYSSCKKDHCKTLNCLHDGACSDGFCICPTGYTGTYCEVPNTASVGLRNKTFTPVVLTVNGVNYTVDTGRTQTFTGGYGDSMSVQGTTHGDFGITVGIKTINTAYPISGTIVRDIVVDSGYFFLKVRNENATEPFISQVHVNYLQPGETLDIVHINNDGRTYFVGYYKAYKNTHVRLEKTPNYIDYNNLNLPFTANQSYTAVYN